MSKFSVGEMCEVINPGAHIDWTGRVVTITSGPFICGWAGCQVLAYEIDTEMKIHETSLRKLPGDSFSIHKDTLAIFTKKQRSPDDVPVREGA